MISSDQTNKKGDNEILAYSLPGDLYPNNWSSFVKASVDLDKVKDEIRYLMKHGAKTFKFLDRTFNINKKYALEMFDFIKENKEDTTKIIEELQKKAAEKYVVKEEEIGAEQMRELERVVMLKVVDEKWMNHIDNMDELKNGIGLRAYGQQDPVVKYRMEGMDMFEEMIANIKVDVVKILMNIRRQNGEVKRQEAVKITGAALEAINSVDGGKKINTPEYSQTVVNEGPKVGRNDPCPCGSGKKYKNCCGKNA